MTQPVDVAYVDIVTRTKKFRKELKDVINNEVKDLEREMTRVLDEIDKEFANVGKSVDDTLRNIDDAIRDTAEVLKEDLGEALDEVKDKVTDLGDEIDEDFSRSFRRFTDAWDEFDRRDSNRISSTLGRLGGLLSNLGDQVLGVGRNITMSLANGLASIPPLLVPIAIALPPLIGMLVSLGAVVTNAAGVLALLPASLFTLLSIIAPLVIGFNGFGEALGAVMAKDPDKLKEAMKGLTPAARAVVLEFQVLQKTFTQIGDIVQQELFKPLVGDLTNLMAAVKGPLTAGLASVAGALGNIMSDLAGVLASPEGVETIASVFQTTTDILQIMRPVISDVARSVLNLVQASQPFLVKFAELFAKVLEKFSAFIDKATEGQIFEDFMNSAIASLQAIVDVADSVLEFFGALFTPEMIVAGQMVLALISDLFDQFTEFLKSPAGKRFLEDLALLAVAATGALSILLQVLGFIFASITLFLGEFVRLVLLVMGALDDWREAVDSAADGIVTAIEGIPQALMGLGAVFANAGRFLIQSFIGGFRQAGNFIDDVAGDIVRGIRHGLNRFIGTINSGIAMLDAALPFSLARIPALAAGGIAPATPGGILARVGEGNQDEVIAPLDDLEDILRERGIGGESSANITFGPGAIQVNFSGAVPTEAEARQVGQSVGDGLLSTLARRGLKLQVRAI